METQLVVRNGGDWLILDTFDTDPIRLTLSFEDISDSAVTSNYSQTFRLPSSEGNYQFFKTAFDVDSFDFDVTQKVESRIIVNGTDFVKGHLRLLRIFNGGNDSAQYECVFMGEVRDFAGKLSDKTLGDIDWSDYTHELNYTNVVLSWNATPDTTNGLMNGDVIYPLVNFGNTYDDNGAPEQPVIQTGQTLGFTSSSNPITAGRFKPMVRMPEVFRRIMAEAEFEYESNFLSSELAKKMYVSAWGNEPIVSTIGGSANNFEAIPSTVFVYSSLASIAFNDEQYDYGDNYDTVTYSFTAPANGTYDFDVKVNGTIDGTATGHDFDIEVIANGSVIASQSFSGTQDDGYPFGFTAFNLTATLSAGQTVYVRKNPTNIGTIRVDETSLFRCTDSSGEINIASQFEADYKQVDFIRDIMTLFHLVMVPHPYDNDKFVIEPFEEFINAGYHAGDANYERVWDITDKVDYDKDVVIEPTFYSQKKQIDFTYAEDKDWLNDLNTKEFKETFGTLKTVSNNELLAGERKVEVKLGSTPVTQIDGIFPTGAGMGNTIIPHIITKDVDSTGLKNRPVKAKTRLLFYNGFKFCGLGATYDQSVWYFEDEGGVAQAFDYYPRVSPYFNSPITAEALDLNWQREVGYARYPILTGQEVINGVSLYDRYWKGYIDSLYDKWGRKVIVTAYLRPSDLTYPTFYWDKIVRVKNSYYRLEKIEGFNIAEPDFCKIHLIKLENPNLDYTEEAVLVWNEWTSLPESVTTGWGSL